MEAGRCQALQPHIGWCSYPQGDKTPCCRHIDYSGSFFVENPRIQGVKPEKYEEMTTSVDRPNVSVTPDDANK
ncbi:hypothetical protein J1614_001989 [Plenodomus biglobosus]|nr:hypothetical protein J1614_001989 [Plenodomus biglobosus]